MLKNKIFDLILIGGSVILIIVAGLLWYHFNGINVQLEQTITVQKAELKNAYKLIQRLNELKAKSSEIDQQKAWLATFIPNEEGQVQFITELQRMAEKNNIEISQCSLEPNTKKLKAFPNYTIYQWKVKLSGKYQGLIGFLDDLPQSQRCINVSELKLTATFDEENKTDYTVGMDCMLDLVTTAPAPVEKVKQ
jgi:Tfp pilus assembly protein PilO